MPENFRPWHPEQTTLLPPSPSEWHSDEHQVYFLLDLVNELDGDYPDSVARCQGSTGVSLRVLMNCCS